MIYKADICFQNLNKTLNIGGGKALQPTHGLTKSHKSQVKQDTIQQVNIDDTYYPWQVFYSSTQHTSNKLLNACVG